MQSIANPRQILRGLTAAQEDVDEIERRFSGL